MRISRFFQQTPIQVGDELELSATNHRHAVQVLRLKVGNSLILFNGDGGEYQAKLVSSDKRNSLVMIEEYDRVNRESTLDITLAVASIKSDKMDFSIQKAVELGVTAIQPIDTERSVIKINSKRLQKKMQHWQGVLIAACEQSGRTAIPELRETCSLESLISDCANKNCIAMLPQASKKLKDLKLKDTTSGITLIIGPEGGFSLDEERMMMVNSVQAVTFGKRILRAETAVAAGITACQMQWGDL